MTTPQDEGLEWARCSWRLFHTLAKAASSEEGRSRLVYWPAFVKAFSRSLLCPPCIDEFLTLCQAHPVNTAAGPTLFEWSVDRHNEVNVRLGKPTLSVQEAWWLYPVTQDATAKVVWEYLYRIAVGAEEGIISKARLMDSIHYLGPMLPAPWGDAFKLSGRMFLNPYAPEVVEQLRKFHQHVCRFLDLPYAACTSEELQYAEIQAVESLRPPTAGQWHWQTLELVQGCGMLTKKISLGRHCGFFCWQPVC